MNTRILFFFLLIGGNLFISCKKEKTTNSDPVRITVGRGPEDILLDENNGSTRILVSCDERTEGRPVFAEIMSVNPSDHSSKILIRKGEPGHLAFHPHGFHLQTVGDKRLLYIINHYRNDEGLNSVLVYEINGDVLSFQKEYKHALMISPNEICALPDGSFYFTNDMGSDNMITEQLFNMYGGSLIHCTKNGDCIYADEKLAFPNGLEVKGQQLFMATTRNKALYRYDIQADGSLTNRHKLSHIDGMDNLRWYGDKLVVAVHPDEIAFVKHSLNEKNFSPSWIYTIDIHNGESERIYHNGGWEISGSSTGLIYDGYLYISQVYGDYLLKVDIGK